MLHIKKIKFQPASAVNDDRQGKRRQDQPQLRFDIDSERGAVFIFGDHRGPIELRCLDQDHDPSETAERLAELLFFRILTLQPLCQPTLLRPWYSHSGRISRGKGGEPGERGRGRRGDGEHRRRPAEARRRGRAPTRRRRALCGAASWIFSSC